ncbi:MAG: hypothetical protein ACTSPY_12030 [Candidatus Helarchaeota archaeon]
MHKNFFSIILMSILVIFSIFQSCPVVLAGTTCSVEYFWVPGQVKNWEFVDCGSSFGIVRRCEINSQGSSVQIQVSDYLPGRRIIDWWVDVFLNKDSDLNAGVEWVTIGFSTGRGIILYNDTVSDGIFSARVNASPNTVIPPCVGDCVHLYLFYDDDVFSEIGNIKDIIFNPIQQISENEWEVSVTYELNETEISQYIISWHITHGESENQTSVKIYNQYFFNSSWSGFGTSIDDQFNLAEVIGYTCRPNFDLTNPNSGSFYQVVGETNTSFPMPYNHDIVSTNGYKFGSVLIPPNYSVTFENGSGTYTEISDLKGALHPTTTYINRSATDQGIGEEIYISLTNLTMNPASGNITKVWYDPEFSFDHLPYFKGVLPQTVIYSFIFGFTGMFAVIALVIKKKYGDREYNE